MRLAVTLVIWAVALMFLASLALALIAVFVPPVAFEMAAASPFFGFPRGGGEMIMAISFAGIAMVLFGMLLVVAFVGALLRRQPITQSRQVRGQMEVEEARIMQEIYRSLGRMEERIDALETLLLDRREPLGADRVRTVEGSGRAPR